MLQITPKKKLLVVALGTLFLIIVFSMITVILRDKKNYYSGVVVATKDRSLLLQSDRKGEREVLIDEMTRVKKGRNYSNIQSVHIGDRIIVTGSFVEGVFVAHIIRILTPERAP